MLFLPEKRDFPPLLSQVLLAQLLPKSMVLEGEPVHIDSEIERVGKDLRKLWPILAKQRGQQEKQDHYSFQDNFVETYASYYLPANCLKLAAILFEAELLGHTVLSPNYKWLDFGCGPGTMGVGLVWYQRALEQDSAESIGGTYIGVDQSAAFLGTGTTLLTKLRERFSLGKFHSQFARVPAEQKGALFKVLKEEQPTVLSFANSIAEWEPNPSLRKKSIQKLLRTLRGFTESDGKDRFLLLIEPGARDSSRELQSMRGDLAKEAEILLPCLDERPCGALDRFDDWCHEEIAMQFPGWHDEIGAHADLRKNSMLFSYLLLRVSAKDAVSVEDDRGNVSQKNHSQRLARMVSQRLERKGYQECFFCTANGKIKVRRQDSDRERIPLPDLARGKIFADLEVSDKGDIESISEDIMQPLPAKFMRRLAKLFPGGQGW